MERKHGVKPASTKTSSKGSKRFLAGYPIAIGTDRACTSQKNRLFDQCHLNLIMGSRIQEFADAIGMRVKIEKHLLNSEMVAMPEPYLNIGMPRTGSRHFGTLSVRGRRRVP
jgi:hypothetical protein